MDAGRVIRPLQAKLDEVKADGLDVMLCSTEIIENVISLLKEQETGHWIYLENCSNFGVYCSECHTKVFDNYPFKKKFSYFCPHCGTRMEGETERR